MTLLDVGDVKPHLKVTGDAQDDELERFLAAAEEEISNRAGPLRQATFTSTVDGCGTSLVLPEVPLQSVTSVTGDSGTTYTPTRLNEKAGLVYLDEALTDGPYVVVYVAGHATTADGLPGDLFLAVREQVKYLWHTKRGRQRADATDSVMESKARVDMLLRPYEMSSIA